MSIFFTENLDFQAHLLNFGGENITKSMHFKFKKNAQILLKQSQKYFEKDQKTTFLIPKKVKNEPLKTARSEQIFERKFRFLGSFINL